jgi:predicted ATPase
MSASLRIHDKIFNETITKYAGHVFSTAGDSFAAAFGRASLAVECAEAIQCSLSEVDWGSWPALSVRLGLHQGEAEERDANYFGPTVNQAARVMAVAHGGQVLLTDGVRDVSGVTVTDLGTHNLRDIETAIHVSQLGIHEFPPLRTTTAGIVSLPSPRTSLVGREESVTKVRQLLATHRLVTLTGIGGCGKTRLAIEVAHRESLSHPQGVWFVDLSTIADEVALPGAFAAALRLTIDVDQDQSEAIANYLAPRDALLIVDNCEHMVDEVADLLDVLLGSCDQIRVLATSRESLEIDGEFTWKIPSLSSADGAPAVQLFVERAQAAGAEVPNDDESTAAIIEIVDRLDGIPLAIELAAARTRTMEVTEILGLLDDRFRLLSGGARRSRQRQATLEGTVQWSYELLDEAEKQMLQVLSVFQGGFALPDVASVASASPLEARRIVDALAAKSLVDVTRDATGGLRHRLLETIRLFALEQLIERGETEETRDRHLAHFHAEPAGSSLEVWASFAGMHRVDVEYENLRSAAMWAIEQDRTAMAQRLMALISEGAEARGEVQLVIDCLELNCGLEPQDRIFVNSRLGIALNTHRHERRAESVLQAACATGAEYPSDYLVGALIYSGINRVAQRDVPGARADYEAAREFADAHCGINVRAMSRIAMLGQLVGEWRFSELVVLCDEWIVKAPEFGFRHIFEGARAWGLLRLDRIDEATAATSSFTAVPPASQWAALNLVIRHAVLAHTDGPDEAARSMARVTSELVARRPLLCSDVLQVFAYAARLRGDEARSQEIVRSTRPSASGAPIHAWLLATSLGATSRGFLDVQDAYFEVLTTLQTLDDRHRRRLLDEELAKWS